MGCSSSSLQRFLLIRVFHGPANTAAMHSAPFYSVGADDNHANIIVMRTLSQNREKTRNWEPPIDIAASSYVGDSARDAEAAAAPPLSWPTFDIKRDCGGRQRRLALRTHKPKPIQRTAEFPTLIIFVLNGAREIFHFMQKWVIIALKLPRVVSVITKWVISSLRNSRRWRITIFSQQTTQSMGVAAFAEGHDLMGMSDQRRMESVSVLWI